MLTLQCLCILLVASFGGSVLCVVSALSSLVCYVGSAVLAVLLLGRDDGLVLAVMKAWSVSWKFWIGQKGLLFGARLDRQTLSMLLNRSAFIVVKQVKNMVGSPLVVGMLPIMTMRLLAGVLKQLVRLRPVCVAGS